MIKLKYPGKSQTDYQKRFFSVVTFLTITSIKKHFKSLDEYFKAPNSRKGNCLHIDVKVLQKLTRIKRHCHLKKFLQMFSNQFTYHKHCHKHYKSGKKFSRNSWFEIDKDLLKKLFADESNFNTATCPFLTKKDHTWIDKHIYNYKETDMTKAEKEQLKKECEEGKHIFPYEIMVKTIEKQEHRKAKTQERRIKKAIAENDAEKKQLAAKVEQLEAENNHLKQLKDLNSDIDDEETKPNEAEKEKEDLKPIEQPVEDAHVETAHVETAPKPEAPVEPPAQQVLDDSDFWDYVDNDKPDAAPANAAPANAAPANVAPKPIVQPRVGPLEFSRVGPLEFSNDDIDESDAPGLPQPVQHIVNHLQEYISKKYITVLEAKHICKIAGAPVKHFKEAPGGVSAIDLTNNAMQRLKIFKILAKFINDNPNSSKEDKEFIWLRLRSTMMDYQKKF